MFPFIIILLVRYAYRRIRRVYRHTRAARVTFPTIAAPVTRQSIEGFTSEELAWFHSAIREGL